MHPQFLEAIAQLPAGRSLEAPAQLDPGPASLPVLSDACPVLQGWGQGTVPSTGCAARGTLQSPAVPGGWLDTKPKSPFLQQNQNGSNIPSETLFLSQRITAPADCEALQMHPTSFTQLYCFLFAAQPGQNQGRHMDCSLFLFPASSFSLHPTIAMIF